MQQIIYHLCLSMKIAWYISLCIPTHFKLFYNKIDTIINDVSFPFIRIVELIVIMIQSLETQ